MVFMTHWTRFACAVLRIINISALINLTKLTIEIMNNIKYLSRFNLLLLFAMLSILLYGCNDKEIYTADIPILRILTDEGEKAPVAIGIPAIGDTKVFSIEANSSWSVTKEGVTTDWLTVSPSESSTNGEISIKTEPNWTESPRKITLRFAIDGMQVNALSITQLGFVPSMEVFPLMEEPLEAAGGEIMFTITTNGDAWSYAFEEEEAWLIEKKKTNTSITFTAAKYLGAAPRSIGIRFYLDNYNISEIIEVQQEGVKLEGYNTKLYGDKLWMIENLNEGGEDGNLGWILNNDPAKAAIHGRFYSWNEAMTGIPNATNAQNPYTWGSSGIDDAGNPYILDGSSANSYNIQIQGACPEGWHVPNMNDWYDLIVAIKQDYNITGNTIRDIADTKDGYIIATTRETGILGGLNLTNWGVVGPYLKGSSPSSSGGLWSGGTTFHYGGNASLGFENGNYPLYKALSDDIGFNILPSGRRTTSGNFEHEGLYSYHWVAYRGTANPNNPLRVTIGSNNANFSNAAANPLDGLCLRCVANY